MSLVSEMDAVDEDPVVLLDGFAEDRIHVQKLDAKLVAAGSEFFRIAAADVHAGDLAVSAIEVGEVIEFCEQEPLLRCWLCPDPLRQRLQDEREPGTSRGGKSPPCVEVPQREISASGDLPGQVRDVQLLR